MGDFYEGGEYTHYMGRSPPVPAPTRPVPCAALLPWPPRRTATSASLGAAWRTSYRLARRSEGENWGLVYRLEQSA